ncbi:MAG: RNA-binding protein [bacterium]|nr:RNA-binding protein [bacterium]
MSNKLYIGNLSWGINDEKLQEFFAAHGNVTSARVATDRDTGRSRGFGFVEFETEDDAKAALEATNGQELDGRELNVDFARPKQD